MWDHLNLVAAMDNTGTLNTINRYTAALRSSSMSQKVNELHKMCLLPLLKDILSFEGRLRKFVTRNDRKIWDNFILNCYPDLKFESACGQTMNGYIYVGTEDYLPGENEIVSLSKEFNTSVSKYIASDRVTGTYFWIAVPYGMTLKRVDNMSFQGDWIELSKFTRVPRTIRNTQYYVYYVHSTIPLMSTYKITVE